MKYTQQAAAGARIVALLLLGLGLIYLLQDRLLYFPDQADQAAYLSQKALAPWPDRESLRGLVHVPAGPIRGTAIVFHGNAGHAGHRGWYAEQLGRQGLRVILAEYPGYGPRPGKPGEATLVQDAAQTLVQALANHGSPLLVVGESLGAGVAAGAVARAPAGVAGVMLITPWDRLENVARHHYPYLPVSLLLRDRYDSVAALQSFAGPVLVAVAEQDSIVPARFGRALHDALPGKKRLISWPGIDHNDWPGSVDDPWWRSSTGFLLEP